MARKGRSFGSARAARRVRGACRRSPLDRGHAAGPLTAPITLPGDFATA
ncbi:hypothetical protein ACFPM0_24700 [Pseudonocardia sulfidoxydans]